MDMESPCLVDEEWLHQQDLAYGPDHQGFILPECLMRASEKNVGLDESNDELVLRAKFRIDDRSDYL